MNQTIKYVGLLAILPLVLVALSPDLIGEVDAQKSERSSERVSPVNYGSSIDDIGFGASVGDTSEVSTDRSTVGRDR